MRLRSLLLLFHLGLLHAGLNEWTPSTEPTLIPLGADTNFNGTVTGKLTDVEDCEQCFDQLNYIPYLAIAFSYNKTAKTCQYYSKIYALMRSPGVDTFLIQKMNCPAKEDILDDVKELFNKLGNWYYDGLDSFSRYSDLSAKMGAARGRKE
ncbi:hypothetical protein QR680_019142 [Steinernema hermaphroditum]|uniref:Saposin B-type domain-containing protein n=1 Tax=Steinernema hermaphroditum TaxID=289476 RepID=A0AA39HM98_9BILA|nr:hypothetical protein QR680_019142 [Steinernema hermaphroditum]